MPASGRLYILDLDGTLVDSLDDLTASVNVMRAVFSLPPLTPPAVKQMVGQGARNLVQRALPGFRDHDVDRALPIFLAHNEAHLCDRTSLYSGVFTTLTGLSAKGHLLALISNKHEALCRRLLAYFQIEGLFGAILGGDSLSKRKPDPEPLYQVMSLLARNAEETVMVGDSINDVAAGKSAGVITVGCTYGYGEPAELSTADYRINDFPELLGLEI